MTKKNYFEVLGVPFDATDEQIERAFRDRVKEHPPRKDPEGFKLINEAGQIRDPEFRRAYLEHLKEEDIQEDLDQFHKFMEEKDYKRALETIERAIQIHPDLPMLYDMKGFCFLKIKDCWEAISCFKKAYSLHPSAEYINNIGLSFFEMGYNAKAEEYVRKSLDLNPQLTRAIILLSRIYFERGNSEEAQNILENAIFSDGKLDFEDFDLLIELLLIQGFTEKRTGFGITLSRIKLATSRDKAEFHYATNKLYNLAFDFLDSQFYAPAYQIFTYLNEVEPDEDLIKLIEYCAEGNEAELLVEDEQMAGFLKGYCLLTYFKKRFKPEKIEEIKEASSLDLDYLLQHDRSSLRSSLNRLKNKYHNIYKSNQKYFDNLRRLAYQNPTVANTANEQEKRLVSNKWTGQPYEASTSNTQEKSGAGGAIAGAVIGGAIGGPFGAIIGGVIGSWIAKNK